MKTKWLALGVVGLPVSLALLSLLSPATPHEQTVAANAAAWENRLQLIVASAGERCPAGIRAFHQGMDLKSGYNFWNLRCSNGSAYSISLLDGQPSRVLSCDVLKKVSQVECFRTFTDQRR